MEENENYLLSKKEVVADAFKWLFIGLLLCFVTSYVTSMNETILNLVYGSLNGYGYIVFIGAELLLCIVLSLNIHKMKHSTAVLLYLLYTALTGLSLNGIFVVYTSSSISVVFLATALIFGIFALIGKNTNMDLSKIGTYLFIALIAIIILEVINIFLLNNTLNIILCIVTIVLFSGYVAYDVNRLLKIGENVNNGGIFFAFQLFLDFINIFIKLLQLFGKRRD